MGKKEFVSHRNNVQYVNCFSRNSMAGKIFFVLNEDVMFSSELCILMYIC